VLNSDEEGSMIKGETIKYEAKEVWHHNKRNNGAENGSYKVSSLVKDVQQKNDK